VTVNEVVPVISDRPIRLTAPDLVDHLEHPLTALRSEWTRHQV
jgi:hypothetical protein